MRPSPNQRLQAAQVPTPPMAPPLLNHLNDRLAEAEKRAVDVLVRVRDTHLRLLGPSLVPTVTITGEDSSKGAYSSQGHEARQRLERLHDVLADLEGELSRFNEL